MVPSKIRSADSRSKNAGKKRRILPKMPLQSGNAGDVALQPMQGGPDRKQQGAEALMLVIPCELGKPDRIKPLLLVETNEFGGPEHGVYQCEQCTRIYHTRKAWALHAGMIANKGGNCPGS
jgi:hypothetical protein